MEQCNLHNQEDPWIMYLIVRESLNMSIGKTAAQVGHAVGLLYEEYQSISKEVVNTMIENTNDKKDYHSDDIKNIINYESFYNWINDNFRKVVLRAKDSQWNNLKEKLNCVIVIDSGFTEIEPGSETVIGVWPMKKSQRPNFLKRLQTL